jgi:hypothetical protein
MRFTRSTLHLPLRGENQSSHQTSRIKVPVQKMAGYRQGC